MTKITAKFILNNLSAMAHGQHITFRGSEYWMVCDMTPDYKYDTDNGTIYYISADRKLSGSINGYEYGKVVNGIPYRV